MDAFSHPVLMARVANAQKEIDGVADKYRTREAELVARITEMENKEKQLRDEVIAWETENEKAKVRAQNEREKLLEMHKVEVELITKEHEKAVKVERDGQLELQSQIDSKCEELNVSYAKCEQLEARIKELESSLRQDKDKRVRALNDKLKLMSDDVSSLNAVLELKDEKIKDLGKQLMEKELEIEQQRPIKQQNNVLKQKLEQLEISLDNKIQEINQLKEENFNLRAAAADQTKEKKRLSLRNEELEFALSQSMHTMSGLNLSQSFTCEPAFFNHDQPSMSTPFKEPFGE